MMDAEKLAGKLARHGQWLRDEPDGERMDLRHADLTGVALTDANLRYANLRHADLHDADLTRADLTRADLTDADLTDADLTRANLTGADLTHANLRYANLTRASLTRANLTGAVLDYSCWPLWCGSFGIKADDRLVAQLIAHITRLDVSECDDRRKAAVEALHEWRNDFCGFQSSVMPLPATARCGEGREECKVNKP